MDRKTQSRLFELNQAFYDQFAGSFSATRHQAQPGVQALVERMTGAGSVLDVGCGNGTLARALQEQSFSGRYLGVDMSAGLLRQARSLTEDPSARQFVFQQVDLAETDWHTGIPRQGYDWITCFAVLHHIPGAAHRQEIVLAMAELLADGGSIAVSVWQWQNSPQLRKRVLPWSDAGLDAADLDKGDVLLDWRAGEHPGLRYVHTFDEAELASLAEEAGLRVTESYYSDGKPGNLALYQVWETPN